MKYFLSILIFTISIYANNADDIYIIATDECKFDSIDNKSIKDLFLKKIRYYKNTYIEVLDNDTCYDNFLLHYLKKSPKRMRIYWTRMIFTGSKKPPKKISQHDFTKAKDNLCHVSYTKKENVKGWKILDVVQ